MQFEAKLPDENSEYCEIILPDEFRAKPEDIENAKITNQNYIKVYDALSTQHEDANDPGTKIPPTIIIAFLAKMTIERIIPSIGLGIKGRDLRLLQNILERHIAQVVFVKD